MIVSDPFINEQTISTRQDSMRVRRSLILVITTTAYLLEQTTGKTWPLWLLSYVKSCCVITLLYWRVDREQGRSLHCCQLQYNTEELLNPILYIGGESIFLVQTLLQDLCLISYQLGQVIETPTVISRGHCAVAAPLIAALLPDCPLLPRLRTTPTHLT